jgi:hypothetical protein
MEYQPPLTRIITPDGSYSQMSVRRGVLVFHGTFCAEAVTTRQYKEISSVLFCKYRIEERIGA